MQRKQNKYITFIYNSIQGPLCMQLKELTKTTIERLELQPLKRNRLSFDEEDD